MLKTVEGFYQDGQIQLSELPQEVKSNTQVLVTFLDSDKIDSVKLRQLIDQLEMQAKYDISEDLQDLRTAKQEESKSNSVSLEDVKKMLNLS